MVLGFGKLFGKKETAPAADAEAPAAAEAARTLSAFLRRDAVFDRGRKLAGHVIRLQHVDAGLGDAPTVRQKALDDALLASLAGCAGSEGWGKLPIFVPVSSVSLGNPALERVPPENVTLLVHLAPESEDAVEVADRMAELTRGGFRLGIFRQPRHPAFAGALLFADVAAIDVAGSQGINIRDFSVALRSEEVRHAMALLALNIESHDDFRLCYQCHFGFFHGPFAATAEKPEEAKGDPHKLHLLHLFNLVQSDADTAVVADALKKDPLLTFRILRYLNSAAVGLSRPISSIDQALVMLGRQRLARWLSVLLFSVKEPDFTDWLLVESALARGRMLELLGADRFPAAEADHLFITGVFSRLDRLLRMPLPQALEQVPLPANVRNALLEGSGPYAPLLAVTAACEEADIAALDALTVPAGLDPDQVNRALIKATTWANDITDHWE